MIFVQEQGKRAKLILSLDEAGRGSASLDGIDLSPYVTAVEFSASANSLTQIKLTLAAHVDAEVTAKLDQIALAKPSAEQQQSGDFVTTADGRRIHVRRKPAA